MTVHIITCRDHSSEHRHFLAQPMLHKHLLINGKRSGGIHGYTLLHSFFWVSQLIDLTLLFIFVLFVCLFVFLVVIQLSIVGNTQ